MKDNIIVTAIVAVALILSSVFIMNGLANSKGQIPAGAFSLYGYEGVLYRLNSVNGRLDALVPSNEAAVLVTVGQIQFPAADAKLTEQQKQSVAQNLKTLSQYIVGERGRSLGFSNVVVQPSGEKKK